MPDLFGELFQGNRQEAEEVWLRRFTEKKFKQLLKYVWFFQREKNPDNRDDLESFFAFVNDRVI